MDTPLEESRTLEESLPKVGRSGSIDWVLWFLAVLVVVQLVGDVTVSVLMAIYALVPWTATLGLIGLRKLRGGRVTALDRDLIRFGVPLYWIWLNIVNGIMAAKLLY